MEISASTTGSTSTQVVVHPLVLLSVTDHYMRLGKGKRDFRVVGVLLGSRDKNVVDVTNSFAVPFEEDSKISAVWFLDHNFLQNMYWKFKKVNTREDIVGFYSTGPRIRENDLKIAALFRKYVTPAGSEPVFVIIDVRPDQTGLPTTAYEAVEEVESDGKEIQRVFKHIPSSIEAEEAEEVGVEHLLRDINDPYAQGLSLAGAVREKGEGLIALVARLEEAKTYLERCLSGRLPPNPSVLYPLQDALALLPNLNVDLLVRSLLIKTNDLHLAMYLSSLIRSVTSLHDLLNNRIQVKEQENKLEQEELEKEKEKLLKKNGSNTTSTSETKTDEGIGMDLEEKPAGSSSPRTPKK